MRLPSPSMTVALLALFVALGGTGYAAIKLPKNSVTSKAIKKGAVTNSKLASNAVTSSKVKNDTLTGSDILESSLTLPTVANATNATNAQNANHATSADSATNATNATNATSATSATNATNAEHANSADTVAGTTPKKVVYRGATGDAAVEILNLNGLTLTANCVGGDLSVNIGTTVDDAAFGAVANADDLSADNDGDGQANSNNNDLSNAFDDDDFDIGDTQDIVGDTPLLTSEVDDEGSGSLTYVRQDGGVVTLNWIAEETAGTTDCLFAGIALSTP
jgi:hypothetical protein